MGSVPRPAGYHAKDLLASFSLNNYPTGRSFSRIVSPGQWRFGPMNGTPLPPNPWGVTALHLLDLPGTRRDFNFLDRLDRFFPSRQHDERLLSPYRLLVGPPPPSVLFSSSEILLLPFAVKQSYVLPVLVVIQTTHKSSFHRSFTYVLHDGGHHLFFSQARCVLRPCHAIFGIRQAHVQELLLPHTSL